MDVRRCRASDAADLWVLFNEEDHQHFADFSDLFASPQGVADWLEALRPGNFQVVAVVGGAIVGFAGLYPLQGRQNHTGLISLGVATAFQRQGYGRALLSVILATADHFAGLCRVQLQVVAENERAIALYESCGFRVEGRHPRFARRGSEYVEGLTMARILES